MKAIVKDPAGWYFGGFHPQGSEVEVSESVYNANKNILDKKETDKPVKEK